MNRALAFPQPLCVCLAVCFFTQAGLRAADPVARTLTNFDDQSRVYQTIRYGVDPTTGILGNSLVDNTWYDPTGKVLMQLPAGSRLFSKSTYDGLGRNLIKYTAYTQGTL